MKKILSLSLNYVSHYLLVIHPRNFQGNRKLIKIRAWKRPMLTTRLWLLWYTLRSYLHQLVQDLELELGCPLSPLARCPRAPRVPLSRAQAQWLGWRTRRLGNLSCCWSKLQFFFGSRGIRRNLPLTPQGKFDSIGLQPRHLTLMELPPNLRDTLHLGTRKCSWWYLGRSLRKGKHRTFHSWKYRCSNLFPLG